MNLGLRAARFHASMGPMLERSIRQSQIVNLLSQFPVVVLLGARQVGKTWLVRDLAERSGRNLIEINFERDSRLAAKRHGLAGHCTSYARAL